MRSDATAALRSSLRDGEPERPGLEEQSSNVFVLDTLASVLDPLTSHARECLKQQAAAITKLSTRLDEQFARAIRILFATEGHVVITGLGKSGHVGRKIAATLASTGTPSFFVHSGEALHGDLGMITERDSVIMISYSGETQEVSALIPHLRARGIPTIALVGKPQSTLGRGVDVALDVSVDREVCPNNLAPTSSTLATLAMGDTLAVSLMKLRGFHEADFARLHPGGSLGRRLSRVGDAVVREGVSVIAPGAPLREALLSLSESELPLALVCEGETLHGVVTSDDVRDAMRRGLDMEAPTRDAMNADPAIVEPGVLVAEAERRMEREGLDALVVVDQTGEVVGVFGRRRGG
ncbi:MAG: KpsF/GutQ family sugar-phosphate isomerase [Myxococcota bacterium]|nr:KpsF/GutQ family sugar-phosphate isomerase [Myxococcota bacterium]